MEIALERQRGGVLDKRLVDLDDSEGGPLVLDGLDRARPRDQADRPHSLDESGATDVPAVGFRHRSADKLALRLRDIALDERARVEVELQRSASRSESTSEEARRRDLASLGARLGRARAGG